MKEFRALPVEEQAKHVCLIEFGRHEGRLEPFTFFVRMDGRQDVWAVENSKKFGYLIYNQGGGGVSDPIMVTDDYWTPDPTLPVVPYEGAKVKDPVTGEWVPAAPKRLEALPEGFGLVSLLDEALAVDTVVHCSACQDCFPNNEWDVCHHIFWSDDAGDWSGAGYTEEWYEEGLAAAFATFMKHAKVRPVFNHLPSPNPAQALREAIASGDYTFIRTSTWQCEGVEVWRQGRHLFNVALDDEDDRVDLTQAEDEAVQEAVAWLLSLEAGMTAEGDKATIEWLDKLPPAPGNASAQEVAHAVAA